MNKTKIEWCDYTVNPVKGVCPVACDYCYARAMYKRFKWNPTIRFEDDAFYGLCELDRNSCYSKQPAKVFVGSTIELFHDSIPEGYLKTIFEYVRLYYHNIYIFLTKQPQNLIKWSPFPENCWLGVSVTTKEQLRPAIWGLSDIECNKHFLSLEPLLENVLDQVLPVEWDDAIDWVIVGQQTPSSKATLPKLKWIARIEASCKMADIPLFQKNNLRSLLGNTLRQEFPKVESDIELG